MLGISSIIMAFLEGTKTLALVFGSIALVLAGVEIYKKNKRYEPLTVNSILGVLIGVFSTITATFLLFW